MQYILIQQCLDISDQIKQKFITYNNKYQELDKKNKNNESKDNQITSVRRSENILEQNHKGMPPLTEERKKSLDLINSNPNQKEEKIENKNPDLLDLEWIPPANIKVTPNKNQNSNSNK